MDFQIPHTEQGLKDYVRLATIEIDRSEKRIKNLKEASGLCEARLRAIRDGEKGEKDVKVQVSH